MMATKTATTRQQDSQRSDRLPDDWRIRMSAFQGLTLSHFRRVMTDLKEHDWMSKEQQERAAYVIVDKLQTDMASSESRKRFRA